MQVEIKRSTEKAHLVVAADGRECWIQKRWLRADGTVNDATFERGATRIEERRADEQAARDFKNGFHDIIVERESEKAVAFTARIDLVDVERDITRLVWLPKSQLREGRAPGWLLIAKRAELIESLGDFSRSGGKVIDYFGGVDALAGL